MTYCGSCGSEVDFAARFCFKCGAPNDALPQRGRTHPALLGWGAFVAIVAVAMVLLIHFCSYLQPTPDVVGQWNGSPTNVPATAAQYVGNGMFQVTISNVGAGGHLSGTVSIAGIYSEPLTGHIVGRHISLGGNFSNMSLGGYATLSFNGTVNGNTIDGALTEDIHSPAGTFPVSMSVALSRSGPPQAIVAPSVAGAGLSSSPLVTRISAVQFTGNPGNYSVEIDGTGFGSPPVALPYDGVMGYFKMDDTVEIGYLGDADSLDFVSWSNTQLQITSDTYQSPGDQFLVGVWNPQTQQGATFGGNIPPIQSGTPQISSVDFSGGGQSLHITIDGSGFGPAPPGVPHAPGGPPFTGDTNNLKVSDWAYHAFAGNGGNGVEFAAGNSGSATTLDYESWTDTQIQIEGFAGAYGSDGMVVRSGDPLGLTVQSTNTGRKTAWGGSVP